LSVSQKPKSEAKRAGAAPRALARSPGGWRFVGLGIDLLVFILYRGNGGVVFEPVAPHYNGMTSLPPEDRLANHKAGTKAASMVKRHGLSLVAELYAHLNPMPFEAAAQMEQDLAEDLRQAGYTVTGGH